MKKPAYAKTPAKKQYNPNCPCENVVVTVSDNSKTANTVCPACGRKSSMSMEKYNSRLTRLVREKVETKKEEAAVAPPVEGEECKPCAEKKNNEA